MLVLGADSESRLADLTAWCGRLGAVTPVEVPAAPGEHAVELVKRVATAAPSRPDARVATYAVPVPVPGVPGPGLVRLTSELPLVVDVGVRPVDVPAGVLGFAEENATQLARLGRPAEFHEPGRLYGQARVLEGERFAAAAAEVYARVAVSLRTWAARFGVVVRSPVPLDDATVARVGAAVAAGSFDGGPWYATGTDPEYPGALRTLAVLADDREAAVALGLGAELAPPADHTRRALDVLARAGRGLERMSPDELPPGEEALRNLLVLALQSALPGSVHAEALQGRGRTDILVRVADEPVLVAECKVWYGEKRFAPGIGQLLGYLTPRDRNAALVVFGRAVAPGVLLDRVHAAVTAHPSYVSGAPGRYQLRGPAGAVDVAVVPVALP